MSVQISADCVPTSSWAWAEILTSNSDHLQNWACDPGWSGNLVGSSAWLVPQPEGCLGGGANSRALPIQGSKSAALLNCWAEPSTPPSPHLEHEAWPETLGSHLANSMATQAGKKVPGHMQPRSVASNHIQQWRLAKNARHCGQPWRTSYGYLGGKQVSRPTQLRSPVYCHLTRKAGPVPQAATETIL